MPDRSAPGLTLVNGKTWEAQDVSPHLAAAVENLRDGLGVHEVLARFRRALLAGKGEDEHVALMKSATSVSMYAAVTSVVRGRATISKAAAGMAAVLNQAVREGQTSRKAKR